jgi:hypothetical protein
MAKKKVVYKIGDFIRFILYGEEQQGVIYEANEAYGGWDILVLDGMPQIYTLCDPKDIIEVLKEPIFKWAKLNESYDAILDEDGIVHVGCQNIQVRKIYELLDIDFKGLNSGLRRTSYKPGERWATPTISHLPENIQKLIQDIANEIASFEPEHPQELQAIIDGLEMVKKYLRAKLKDY